MIVPSTMLVCVVPIEAVTLTQIRFYVNFLFRDVATAISDILISLISYGFASVLTFTGLVFPVAACIESIFVEAIIYHFGSH